MRRSIGFQQQYYADDCGMCMMETQAQHQGYGFHEESWSSGNNYHHNRFPTMHKNKVGAFALDSNTSMLKQHGNKVGAMHNMNMLDVFAVDSDFFMSKQHGKLGSMHMNALGNGGYGMGSELLMSKQHDKLGRMHMNNNRVGAYGNESEFSKSKHHGKLGKSHDVFQKGVHSDHGFGYGHGGGRKFNSGGQREYFTEETVYEEAYAEEHVGAVMAKVEEMRYEHHNWGGDTCYVNPYARNKVRNMDCWTPKWV